MVTVDAAYAALAVMRCEILVHLVAGNDRARLGDINAAIASPPRRLAVRPWPVRPGRCPCASLPAVESEQIDDAVDAVTAFSMTRQRTMPRGRTVTLGSKIASETVKREEAA